MPDDGAKPVTLGQLTPLLPPPPPKLQCSELICLPSHFSDYFAVLGSLLKTPKGTIPEKEPGEPSMT